MSAESSLWAVEKWPGIETRYAVRQVLYENKTDHQHLQLVESELFGRMLLLDGIVQTTEKDEFIYHEMMTHVPLCAHPNPRRVLVIGGGDGGILREVFRHPTVESVTLVEIDQQVIAFSREYLPGISKGAFDDSRLQVIIADGAEFAKNSPGQFDVIIVDSPDPVGPARALFTQTFYGHLKERLLPGGILTRQTGSTFQQAQEQKESWDQLGAIFPVVAAYLFTVPTYVGGAFSAMYAALKGDPLEITEAGLEPRFQPLTGQTRYYNPGVHIGAFRLPEYFRQNLA